MAQADPLDQLKDIHLPPAAEGYILAPGWIIIIALTVLTVVLVVWWLSKRKQKLKLQSAIKSEFEQLKASDFSPHNLFNLMALFKRVCLQYLPAAEIAALNGEQWLGYVNRKLNQPLFNETEIKWLAAAIYQSSASMNKEEWLGLVNKSEVSCLQLHRQFALRQAGAKAQ